jgi:hypothetical protein
MDLMQRLVLTVILMLLSLNLYAAKNPIGWSMSGNIPATTSLNHSYALSFTLVNNLPFTMPTPLKISNNSTPLSQVTMVDNCSGKKLTPGQTCDVGLVLIPKTAGTKTLSVFMEYGKNKVQIPQSAVTTTTQGDAVSSLQGVVLIGFPTAILSNTTYPIKFEFVNNSTSTLNNLVLSQNAGNSAGYTQGSALNCTSLNPGDTCVITGSFVTAATTGAVSVGYTLTAGSLSAKVTSSSIINNTSGAAVRTFTFINNCTFSVWFGLVSGNVNGNPCKTNSDCTYPSVCNPAANKGAGYCFYPAPAPANGVYQLSAVGGGSNTNTASIADYGFQYVWSGNLAGRTGCTSSGCVTADCGGGTGACPTGEGFDQPASLGEFTLQRSTIDSYDISILNGTNIGIQVTPTTSYTFANAFSPPEYNCGSPGKVMQTNGLGGCSWTFDPTVSPTPAPAYRYRYVTPTSNLGCTDATSCPGGTVCGLNFNKVAGTLNSYCGTLLGYNTANQVCSYKNTSTTVPTTPSNPGDPYFDCDTASGVTSAGNINHTTGNYPAGTAYTNWALFSCQAQPNMDLNTCFNTIANPPPSTTNGCGCVDWATYGSGVVVPSDTPPCITFNSIWGSNVLPGIVFIKRGCPTAYSWPFDDKASSFGCSDISASHTTNSVNYTITFCPS